MSNSTVHDMAAQLLDAARKAGADEAEAAPLYEQANNAIKTRAWGCSTRRPARPMGRTSSLMTAS